MKNSSRNLSDFSKESNPTVLDHLTDETKIQGIKYKDIGVSLSDRYVMIQLFAMTKNGPTVLSKVFKGKNKIDGEKVGKLLEEAESNIILLDKSKKDDDKVAKLTNIIKSYDYIEVSIDMVFNLMGAPK